MPVCAIMFECRIQEACVIYAISHGLFAECRSAGIINQTSSARLSVLLSPAENRPRCHQSPSSIGTANHSPFCSTASDTLYKVKRRFSPCLANGESAWSSQSPSMDRWTSLPCAALGLRVSLNRLDFGLLKGISAEAWHRSFEPAFENYLARKAQRRIARITCETRFGQTRLSS